MARRSQPNRLLWPPSPEQWERIDEMFQELYDDTDNGSLEVSMDQITSGVLDVDQGGTGNSSWTVGDLLYASDTDEISGLAAVAAGSVLRAAGVSTAPAWSTFTIPNTFAQGDLIYASAANILAALAKNTSASRYISNTGTDNAPAWAQVDLTNGVTGTLPAANGGTGLASYAIGDILYASGATTLASLADVSAGSYLRSGGVTTAPVWSTVKLPNTATQGDLWYASASNTMSALAKNTSATRYVSNTGSSNNPAWAQVDLSNGVTGTLSATNGGTGTATVTTGDLLYGSAANTWSKLADVAAGSYLRSGGVTTAPVWSTVTLPNTASQGDVWYASAANVISALAKSASATRYLSNTGTDNNPAWAQVNVANGVTGTLPLGNGGTGATAFGASRVPYMDAGNSALTSSSGFTFDGTTLTIPGQIAFPSTQSGSSNANTLDDYEEGTFSPTVLAASGSGATYTTQSGTYIKIGTLMYIVLDVVLSGLGTLSGAVSIGGLPYTAGSNAINGGAGAFYFSSLFANEIYLSTFADAGASTLALYGLRGVARANPVRYQVSDLTATSRIALFGIVNTAA